MQGVPLSGQGVQQEANIAFLHKLFLEGAPLAHRDLIMLRDHGLVNAEVVSELLKAEDGDDNFSALDRHILTAKEYDERCVAAGYYDKWRHTKVRSKDWMPENRARFDDDFHAFINSHFRRFCDLIAYEPFYLYKKQADRWLAEKEEVPETAHHRKLHRKEEVRRCRENSYYAISKYGWYKEANLPGGEGRFVCNMAHIFLLFLFDCGRSAYVGKGRQMASTTLLMLLAAIRMGLRINFHCKLIACDLETTEEIFEDKFKYGYGRFPTWMKAVSLNDSGKIYRVTFDADAEKGSRKARTSKLSIVAPKVSAINGGAPDIVFVDEAVFLPEFNEMVKEGRPTLFATGADGKLTMLRQLWAWGTGGRSKKGGGSFEKEHRGLFEKWTRKDFNEGIVPVFMDWTCRPNVTEAHFLRERAAYRAGSMDGETERSLAERDVLFRQHYPCSLDDMYSVTGNTLIPPDLIIKGEEKIYELPEHLRPQYGYFDPVYDTSRVNPVGSFLRHPVKDALWVPLGSDVTAPCVMFTDHTPNWKDRNYQYTDPIATDEGFSKHASAIWDAHFRTVACVVNMRTNDPYDSYVQAQLMGLYYRNHGQEFTPHLIENNIGKTLIKYLQGHEWNATRSLVTNMMLPDYLQGGGDIIGINTKASRKRDVVSIGHKMLMAHGSNIYIPSLWQQLKFFTGKTTNSGNTTWQTSDRTLHQDDVVDAVFGSYVCRMCYQGRMPMEIDQAKEEAERKRPKFRRQWDPAARQVRFLRTASGKRTPIEELKP